MSDLVISTLTQGLIYALISFGVYITYSVLDFPDLTTDGCFPLGAAVTAVLLTRGADPWVTLPASALAGALAGLATGLIHVKLRVRNLLAGIITMTALFSINLQIAGSNLAVDRGSDTIFTAPATMALFGGLDLLGRKLAVSLVLIAAVKLILDAYFRTKSGLLLRAVGDNGTLVTSLAKDRGNVKILGLVIANALVALAGCIVCHEQRSFSATMGTGQVVFGLATVIIGVTLFRWLLDTPPLRRLSALPGGRWLANIQGTTMVIVGSILYKACIQIAISLGLPANLLKLVTAVLFLLVLVLSGRKGEEIIHA
jgi:putative ABC transport system permease protein